MYRHSCVQGRSRHGITEEDTMAKRRTLQGARSFNTFGRFKDHETDWLFKRVLAYMNNRCAETGECLEAARHIDERDAETWIRAWAELAAKVERQGDESLSGEHAVSARDSFLRAMNYYRAAEYACAPSHPRFDELWRKSVECMAKACPLFSSPLEKTRVRFEKYELPGYFWRPDSSGAPRPTIILAGGTDSSIEEMIMSAGPSVLERGYNLFTFDYPGHRGAVHAYPDCVRRPDYEKPFKAAIDHLLDLPGVDPGKIILAGFSFGGYVAARVAIHEKRLAAVVPDSPIIDLPEIANTIFATPMAKLPKSLLEAGLEWKFRKSPIIKNFIAYCAWLRGYRDLLMIDSLRIDYSDYDIAGELGAIACPTLALAGAGEGEVMVKQAKDYYERVGSKLKKYYLFTLERDGSDDHCQLDNTSRGMQVMLDWLDEAVVAPRRSL